ncbi:MAG TPA: MMPL family transporter, partial [Solirubrobacteraceae bacterium]
MSGEKPTGGGKKARTPSGLGGLGARCAGHPRVTIAAWLIALVAAVGIANAAGGTFSDKLELRGTQANTGLKLLNENEKGAGGHTGQIVFHVSSGTLAAKQSQIEAAIAEVRRLDHVESASDPFAKESGTLSQDGRTAYSTVHFDERTKTLGESYINKLEAATSGARSAGVEVEYGGGLDELFRPAANDALSEVIGFTVALLVLLIGFGSVAGAVIPLLSALLAVAI